MGGGSKPAPAPVVQQRENPYDDSWIHDKFATGQERYNELEAFMGERRAALAQPKYYDVGGGMSVKQDNFGQYFQGQLQDQQRMFDQQLADMQRQSQAARGQMGSAYDARLGDITAQAGANQAALQAQQEAMARQGERARIQEAYGDQNMPGVTGVQTKKRQNLGSYGTTGGGFNRSGLRIQNLNI
tara:strand:- start:382 stop:939 length:558 start_codon:yes stop_codon:yes gene_type:complete